MWQCIAIDMLPKWCYKSARWTDLCPLLRLKEHDILAQLKDAGITAIFNLQQENEHAHCGDGNIDGQFSYSPEKFLDENISVHLYGWQDFGCPDLDCLFDIVKIMSDLIDRGEKVLVHCHAGLGRTGLLIACHLIYTYKYTASEAVTLVRLRRTKAIQTKAQLAVTRGFERLILYSRVVFTDTDNVPETATPRRKMCLGDTLKHQESSLLMSEISTLGGLPKIAVVCLRLFNQLCTNGSAVSQLMQHRTDQFNERLQSAKTKINAGLWNDLETCTGPMFAFGMFEDWLRQLSQPVISNSACEHLHQCMTDAPETLPAGLDDPEGLVLLGASHFYKSMSSIADTNTNSFQLLGGRVSAALLHEPWPADDEPARNRDSVIYTPGTFSVVLLWLSTLSENQCCLDAAAVTEAPASPLTPKPADNSHSASLETGSMIMQTRPGAGSMTTQTPTGAAFDIRMPAKSFSRVMSTPQPPVPHSLDFDDADLTELSEVAVAQQTLQTDGDNDDADMGDDMGDADTDTEGSTLTHADGTGFPANPLSLPKPTSTDQSSQPAGNTPGSDSPSAADATATTTTATTATAPTASAAEYEPVRRRIKPVDKGRRSMLTNQARTDALLQRLSIMQFGSSSDEELEDAGDEDANLASLPEANQGDS